MSKPSRKKQEHRRRKELAKANKSPAYKQKMARLAKSPGRTLQADNAATPQFVPTAEVPREMELALTPLLEESLQLGDSTVNFDASMPQFVQETGVDFPMMCKAAEAVHRAVNDLGLGDNLPTHTYVQFTGQQSSNTFLTGVVEELTAGPVRINRVMFCCGPSIKQGLLAVRDGVRAIIKAGHGPANMSLQEVLRFTTVRL